MSILIRSPHRPKWILYADIKGFFENNNHDWLLANIPMDKAILNSWLKVGVGPISPTIANMALDGLERHIKKSGCPKVNVIRYRESFIVTAATKRI